MDYLAHALWTRAVYHEAKHPWWGAFWGVFPDTVSWVPFFFYRIFTSGFSSGRSDLVLPGWMDSLYGVSHSVVVFAVVVFIIYLVKKRIPIYIWGWLLHIAIDVPTHSANMWPTPFLWPVSDFKFPGISWGTQSFMIANYAILSIVYLYIIWKGKQTKNVHRNN